MKKTIAATLLACAATGANAQSMPFGSMPQGFEISGAIDFTYAFEAGGGSESFGLGYLDLGYRYEVNSNIAIGLGLRAVGYLEGGASDLDANFYAYAEFQNFRLTYGAADNAASHFDSDYATFENLYFNLDGLGVGPIGIHPEFGFVTDMIRLDARFGQFDLSASYSNEANTASIGVQTQFGATNVIVLYEWEANGDDFLASLAVDHSFGAIDLAAYVGIPSAGAPFDYIARVSATYHVSDALSVKGIYSPAGFLVDDIYEISATYQVNDLFSIGASVGGGVGDTIFGINASATF